MPRSASAAITRGSWRSASLHSWNSSTVMFGCSPGRCSQRTTRSSPSETSALYARPSSRFQQIASATRAIASPAAKSRTTALGGSCSSIEAKRQRSPTPWSRRRMAATAWISSADSGSSGCTATSRRPGSAGTGHLVAPLLRRTRRRGSWTIARRRATRRPGRLLWLAAPRGCGHPAGGTPAFPMAAGRAGMKSFAKAMTSRLPAGRW